MERVAEITDVDLVRRANARLGSFFQRFSGAAVLGTSEEVEALLQVERALESVKEKLDGTLQGSSDVAVRQELARYRDNLVRLRVELAGMQQSAESCRARLFLRQKHLHAAQAWCAASRGIS